MDALELSLGLIAYGSVGQAFLSANKVTPSVLMYGHEDGAASPDNDVRNDQLDANPHVLFSVALLWTAALVLWPVFAVWELFYIDWPFWAHRIARHPGWDCTDESQIYDHDDHPLCQRGRWRWITGGRSTHQDG
ncbi:hypothetical protein [Streptomyces sp. I05A-00742]|uniref:hypothetical protein n=1 Tax=Streptomyces sp. I05A-00742 TaxID=2732853 RepID=UPI0014878C8E|nr:hypothetical protein [Streptomyces sp. I05A-00742]